MRIHVRASLLAVALTVGVAACGNKAEEAKKEADQKAAEAAKEADDKAAAAKKEADDKAAKANAEIKAKLQKDLDAAERKAVYLKEKAAKVTGATKKNADAAVTELDTRSAAAKASVAKLDTSTGAAWETQKVAVESDIAALNKAVDSLETTLKK
jgi:colicin import membrane protein